MNSAQEELIWQRLSKILFGGRRATDEGLFTYGVMERIRLLAAPDLAWPRFLRWALPMLGAGLASLVLAARTPAMSTHLLLDQALSAAQTQDQDPLTAAMEEAP